MFAKTLKIYLSDIITHFQSACVEGKQIKENIIVAPENRSLM